ncbi:hypothetical protein GR927_20625 [Mycolicibacterium sp. 3033]|nr:hypothetical protein [Mycolicibacterium aurantiacum]
MTESIVGLIVIWLFFAAACALIADLKNLRPRLAFFLLGLATGVIGLAIASLMRPGLPEPPPGMQATRCPRCNAVQNLDSDVDVYECWQCHDENELDPLHSGTIV